AAERLKRLQADELPVPSEPDAADALPGALVDLGEDRELDVLETREQVGISVAHVDSNLDGPRARVAEVAGDLAQRLAVDPPVGVEHGYDDVLRRPSLEQRRPGEVMESGVEHRALALPGGGEVPPEQLDPLGFEAA